MKKMPLIISMLGLAVAVMPTVASAHDWDHDQRPEREIHGRVEHFSPYNLDLRRGPHVLLHDGTIIHPTGIHLHEGMRVSIRGHFNGDRSDFVADRITVLRRAEY